MISLTIRAYKADKLIRNIEPIEIEKATKDIIYFYHEQSKWNTISGDMNFGTTFSLPYWDYLDIRGDLHQDEVDFIRRGSLLMLLSMSMEFYEDLGNFFLSDKENIELVKGSLISFSPRSKSEREIKELTLLLLDNVGKMEFRHDPLISERLNNIFVYNIYGFFRKQVNVFDKTVEKSYKRLKQ